MASAAGAPRVCSMRTIKSDVVVGLGPDGDELAERLDKEEEGWKISGKYVRSSPSPSAPSFPSRRVAHALLARPSCFSPRAVPARRSSSRKRRRGCLLARPPGRACVLHESPMLYFHVGSLSPVS